MTTLPDEIVSHTLSFLPLKYLKSIKLSCRKFNKFGSCIEKKYLETKLESIKKLEKFLTKSEKKQLDIVRDEIKIKLINQPNHALKRINDLLESWLFGNINDLVVLYKTKKNSVIEDLIETLEAKITQVFTIGVNIEDKYNYVQLSELLIDLPHSKIREILIKQEQSQGKSVQRNY